VAILWSVLKRRLSEELRMGYVFCPFLVVKKPFYFILCGGEEHPRVTKFHNVEM
jgi:hypothetical protein